jgi:hypothetical protein
MSRNTKKDTAERNPEFVRKTITVPTDIVTFADEQVAKPEHAGNWSSYVRNLILNDRAKRQKQAA